MIKKSQVSFYILLGTLPSAASWRGWDSAGWEEGPLAAAPEGLATEPGPGRSLTGPQVLALGRGSAPAGRCGAGGQASWARPSLSTTGNPPALWGLKFPLRGM